MAKLKAQAELVEERRALLKSELETIETKAHDKAVSDGYDNGWNEALIEKYAKFLLENDERFNIDAKQKELQYIESNFCREEAETEEAETDFE